MPLSTRHKAALNIAAFIVLVLSTLAGNAALHAGHPDPIILQITGELTGVDHESYREVAFTVPAGVTRITVEVAYDGEDRTVVDLGLFDPERFRGWSGGNKAQFILTESHATPSYLPGPLLPGDWRLILGVPNIRPDSVASFTADITLESGSEALTRGFAAHALLDEPGWYRGELHAHTGHSDGSCLSQSGQTVPCPVYRTVARAGELGMDFIAVTEHNAISHHQSLHELQLAFDRTVLISGREMTTFYGHANMFGTTAFIDLQGSNDRVLDLLARSGSNEARMGGVLETSASAPVTLEVVVSHVPDASIDLYLNGVAADIEPESLTTNGQALTFAFELPVTSDTLWVRAEVRSSQGTVLLLSNPVYLYHSSTDSR